MIRTRLLTMLLAFFTPAALVAAPVPSGGKSGDITELPVAANAMVVVQLNGVERTKDRVVKMLQGVDADLAKEAGEQIDGMLKEMLDGRDLTGLDGSGRVFVALGDFQFEEPPVAFLLPVKDAKTFREKFLTEAERKSFTKGKGGVDEIEYGLDGTPLYLVDTGEGYVVACLSEGTAEAYTGKYEKLTAKQMGGVADAFLTADLGLFLNLSRVNEEYGAQLAQFRAQLPQLFQLVAGQLDPDQLDTIRTLVDGLFQIVEDGTGVVIAVEARPEGLALRAEGAFTAGSETDKMLAAETPKPLKLLESLPKGMVSYSASRWGAGIAGLRQKMMSEFSSDNEKASDAIEELLVVMTEEAGETVSMSGEEFAALSATSYSDAAKVVAAQLAVFSALDEGDKYSNLVLKTKPKVTKAAQKHAGFTLSSAVVEIDFEASAGDAADPDQRDAAIEAMKKLMPEKQTVWFGTDGTRVVQLSAKDWDTAKKMLDQFTSPKAKTGDDKAFAATRGQLPAEVNYLLFTDAVQLLSQLTDYAGQLGEAIPGGGATDLPKLGKVSGDPAYLGVAVRLTKQQARFDVFIPTGAVKSLMKAVEEGEKEKE